MSRTIVTNYGNGRRIIRRNRSANPNQAIKHCVGHMQVNDYGARVAEVYNEETGRLYAQVKLTPSGKMTILYKYSPEEWILRGHLKSFRKHVGQAC